MNIKLLNAGNFVCDGGALFGVVPKKVWQKRYPCDNENECELMMRCMLIEVENRLILIETGAGNKQPDYLAYSKIDNNYTIINALQEANIAPEEITDVILTHLHFDHCGGCTYYDPLGELCLSFPNAQHWVSRSQWENYTSPNIREGNSYFPENMLPIEKAGLLRLINENTSILPSIELKIFDGHTAGHIVPYIHTPQYTFVYTGDVIPTIASIPLAWVSAYDTQPILSIEGKQKILDEVYEKQQILIFGHDRHTPYASISKEKGRHKATPIKQESELNNVSSI